MGNLTGKRILYVTEAFHPSSGGGEKATYQHLLKLYEEGAEIVVITSNVDYQESTHEYPFTVHRVVDPVSKDEYSVNDLLGLSYQDFMHKAAKVIDKAKEYPSDYFNYIIGYACYGPLNLGINVFTLLRDYFDAVSHSIQYDPMPALGTGWEYHPRLSTDIQMVGSPEWARRIADKGNIVPVIPTINPRDFTPTKIIPWEDRPYDFGFINPTAHKGFNTLLKIISQIPQYKFIIKAGGYSESPALSKVEAWFSNVTVGGWYESMGDFYQQCKCIIYPSLWEGFGMVPLEAAANGCIVFANDHPIIRDSNPDFPFFIDAYPPEAMDNWVEYYTMISDQERHHMFDAVAEEWVEQIKTVLADKNIIQKHIDLGKKAIDIHIAREQKLWKQYIQELLALQDV